MFGYRVVFNKSSMKIKPHDPNASQHHKPLHKYVKDIVSELDSSYLPIHKYCTRRKILVPVDEEEAEETQ